MWRRLSLHDVCLSVVLSSCSWRRTARDISCCLLLCLSNGCQQPTRRRVVLRTPANSKTGKYASDRVVCLLATLNSQQFFQYCSLKSLMQISMQTHSRDGNENRMPLRLGSSLGANSREQAELIVEAFQSASLSVLILMHLFLVGHRIPFLANWFFCCQIWFPNNKQRQSMPSCNSEQLTYITIRVTQVACTLSLWTPSNKQIEWWNSI